MNLVIGGEVLEYLPLNLDRVQARIRDLGDEVVRCRGDLGVESREDQGLSIGLLDELRHLEAQLALLAQIQDLLTAQALRDGMDSLDGIQADHRLKIRTTDAPKDQERYVELQVQHLTLRVNIGDFNALLAQRDDIMARGVPVTVLMDPVVEEEEDPTPSRGA